MPFRVALRALTLLGASVIAGSCVTASATPFGPVHEASGSPASGPLAAEVAEAMVFRTRFGLRADELWVRRVAADPASREGLEEFGVPLMPFELSDLQSRRSDRNVLNVVRRYGSAFPEEFAGAYFELSLRNAVVASFSGRLDRHRTALVNLLPEGAALLVREVEWSTADLERFVDRVEADRAWFDTIGVEYLTAGRRINEGHIYVLYRGAQEAARTIEGRYGNPTWLRAEREGPLRWNGPRSDLVVIVRDRSGDPVPGVKCDVASEDPRVGESGALMFGTNANGECLIPNLPAVSYRVTLQRFVDNDHYEPIPDVYGRADLHLGRAVVELVVPDP
jgi:hypothetical protein